MSQVTVRTAISDSLLAAIQKILADKNWSALELERRAGLKRGRIDSLRKGSTWSVDAVAAVAATAGVAVEWMLAGGTDEVRPGDHEPPRSVPVLATASAAGTNRIAYDQHEKRQVHLPPGLHLVKVTGDSMIPIALPGQYVWVTHNAPETGDLALIELEDGEILFKRVFYDDHHVQCISINQDPKYPPITLKTKQCRLRKVLGTWYGT